MAVVSLKYKSKQGTLTAPGDVDPGAMIPIATTTVGSGGASTIQFTSIPQVYEHLQIRAMALSTTANHCDLTINGDTGNNYAAHALEGTGSAAGAYSGTSRANIFSVVMFGGTTTSVGNAVIDILDYTNTNKNTTVRSLRGWDGNGSGNISLISGLWINTAAVTSITLTVRSGSVNQGSSFALYGIKRAGA